MKLIQTQADLEIWKETEAFNDLISFICAVNQAPVENTHSERVDAVLSLLASTSKVVDSIEPLQSSQRYGNKAFRQVLDQLPVCLHSSQLDIYWKMSWGDYSRLDYGSGHELNFIIYLLCLIKADFLTQDDLYPIKSKIFPKYLQITRNIQTKYQLEPAGSHGVWGIDDFCFLPYFWGSNPSTCNGIVLS